MQLSSYNVANKDKRKHQFATISLCIPRTSKMYHKSTQSRNNPSETSPLKGWRTKNFRRLFTSRYVSFLRNCRSTCTSPFATRRKETLNVLWTEKKPSPRWEEMIFTTASWSRDAGSTFLSFLENMSVFPLFVSVRKGILGLDRCVELKFINRRIPGDTILYKEGENRSVGG